MTLAPAPIVLLPGFDGTGELFADFVQVIGDGHSLTIASYRAEVTLDDYIETVSALLPTEPCVLIAESFSGPIAMALAEAHQNRIAKLVLCATFAVSPFRALTRLARFLPAKCLAPSLATRVLLRTLCLSGERGELVDRVFTIVSRIHPNTIKRRVELLSQLDMRQIAGGIRVPSLVLRSTRDRLVSKSNHRKLIQALRSPNVQSVHGPHLLLQSRPGECWGAIRKFVDPLSTPEQGVNS